MRFSVYESELLGLRPIDMTHEEPQVHEQELCYPELCGAIWSYKGDHSLFGLRVQVI